MAYTTSFSEYEADANLNQDNWTKEWNTIFHQLYCRDDGDIGGNTCNIWCTSDCEQASSWDNAGTGTDTEIVFRARLTENQHNQCRIYLRGSGGIGTETGYYAAIQPITDKITMHKLVSGSWSYLITGEMPITAVTEWYWGRFRVSGEDLKLRVWSGEFSSENSGEWDLETTDSSNSSGWVGVGQYKNNLSTEGWDCDWFSVAFDGESAEGPAAASEGDGSTVVFVVSS
jgi:hypothetical protein